MAFLNDSYKILKKKYPVISIDPFNEPSNPFWGPKVNQEGCYFDYFTRWKIIRSLKAKSNDIFIAGVDEFSVGFGLFWYIFSPRSLIDRINIHGYRLSYKEFTFYFDDFNIWKRLLRWFTKKPIWMSEYGSGYSNTIKDSLPLGRKILSDLSLLKPEGWIYWQAVEDTNGSKWGLIQVDFNNPTNINIQKQYYVFKHFTRNIKKDDKYEFINNNIIRITGNEKVKYIILNDTDFDIEYNVKEKIIEYNISNQSNDYVTMKSVLGPKDYLFLMNQALIIEKWSIISLICKEI